MARGEYNGITIYGELMTGRRAEEIYDETGQHPLCNNGISGQESHEFISSLMEFNNGLDGLIVLLDYVEDEDRADTVILYNMLSLEKTDILAVMEIVCKRRPSEFGRYGENTFRIWWD